MRTRLGDGRELAVGRRCRHSVDDSEVRLRAAVSRHQAAHVGDREGQLRTATHWLACRFHIEALPGRRGARVALALQRVVSEKGGETLT